MSFWHVTQSFLCWGDKIAWRNKRTYAKDVWNPNWSRNSSLIGCCWSRTFRAQIITNRKISAVKLRHQHVMFRVKSMQTPLARREFKAAPLKKCFPQGTSLPVTLQCFQRYFQRELSVLVLTVSLSWAFVIWYTLSSVTPLQIPTNM